MRVLAMIPVLRRSLAVLVLPLALALAVRAAAAPRPPATPPPQRPPKAAPPAKPEAEKPAPAPLSAEDAAVVENLDLLQRMELLDDLPVVDPGDDDDAPPSAPRR